MSGRRSQGFTLLEVVVAVFVFATVMSGLIALVSQNLRRTADARDELREVRLAEGKVREILLAAERGELPPPGTTQASFEGDDADLSYELEVAPYGVPLPAKAPKQVAKGSRLFAGGGEPAVRRIVLKVFTTEGGDPEGGTPFVAFVAEPNEAVEATPGEGQSEQTDGQQGDEPAPEESQPQESE